MASTLPSHRVPARLPRPCLNPPFCTGSSAAPPPLHHVYGLAISSLVIAVLAVAAVAYVVFLYKPSSITFHNGMVLSADAQGQLALSNSDVNGTGIGALGNANTALTLTNTSITVGDVQFANGLAMQGRQGTAGVLMRTSTGGEIASFSAEGMASTVLPDKVSTLEFSNGLKLVGSVATTTAPAAILVQGPIVVENIDVTGTLTATDASGLATKMTGTGLQFEGAGVDLAQSASAVTMQVAGSTPTPMVAFGSTGLTTVQSQVTCAGEVNVASTGSLTVAGGAEFTGSLTASGTAQFAGAATTFDEGLKVNGGTTTLGGTQLNVTAGSTNVTGIMTASNTFTTSSALNVDGAATFTAEVTVKDGATLEGTITAKDGLTVEGSAGLTCTAPATFQDTLTAATNVVFSTAGAQWTQAASLLTLQAVADTADVLEVATAAGAAGLTTKAQFNGDAGVTLQSPSLVAATLSGNTQVTGATEVAATLTMSGSNRVVLSDAGGVAWGSTGVSLVGSGSTVSVMNGTQALTTWAGGAVNQAQFPAGSAFNGNATFAGDVVCNGQVYAWDNMSLYGRLQFFATDQPNNYVGMGMGTSSTSTNDPALLVEGNGTKIAALPLSSGDWSTLGTAASATTAVFPAPSFGHEGSTSQPVGWPTA